jgi:multiple antibiotic resistance protein
MEYFDFAIKAFTALLAVIDPLAILPVFIAVTANQSRELQRRAARLSTIYAFALLVVFIVIGNVILHLFAISIDAFRVAGGILLLLIGLEMVHSRLSLVAHPNVKEFAEAIKAEDVALMPLAMPMLSGPGAITTAMTIVSGEFRLPFIIISIIAAALVFFISYLLMANADKISSRIGSNGIGILTRLMGLLLIAYAVQMGFAGAKELMK